MSLMQLTGGSRDKKDILLGFRALWTIPNFYTFVNVSGVDVGGVAAVGIVGKFVVFLFAHSPK